VGESLFGVAKNAANSLIPTHVQLAASKGHRMPCYDNLQYYSEVFSMGKVLAIMKITPKDANAPIAELRQRIEKAIQGKVTIDAFEEIPIFGPLYALRLRFVVEDEAGGTGAVEQIIRIIPGVSEIEIEAVSLI
jgi:translation elongation factor aEF-1 beta